MSVTVKMADLHRIRPDLFANCEIWIDPAGIACNCYAAVETVTFDAWNVKGDDGQLRHQPVAIFKLNQEPSKLRIEPVNPLHFNSPVVAVCSGCEKVMREATDDEIADEAEARYEAAIAP